MRVYRSLIAVSFAVLDYRLTRRCPSHNFYIVIADGAELTGASINAVRNYLKKMLSPTYGPLHKFRFAGKGRLHVSLKSHIRELIEKEQVKGIPHITRCGGWDLNPRTPKRRDFILTSERGDLKSRATTGFAHLWPGSATPAILGIDLF
jgi:hypothetical protein